MKAFNCLQDDENALLQQALAMSMDEPTTDIPIRDTDMLEAAADDQDLALGKLLYLGSFIFGPFLTVPTIFCAKLDLPPPPLPSPLFSLSLDFAPLHVGNLKELLENRGIELNEPLESSYTISPANVKILLFLCFC